MSKEDKNFFSEHNINNSTLCKCNEHSLGNIVLAFFDAFSESFLYSYVFQIIVIVYMYCKVGNGKYWKLMLIGSIFGVFGAVVEHICTSWINVGQKLNSYSSPDYEFYRKDCNNDRSIYILLIIAELGWVISEFAIPFLNLIKLNAVSQGNTTKILNYIITFLFFVFAFIRIYIGVTRYNEKQIYSSNIYTLHGAAFGVTAVADIILSVRIFVELYRNAKKTYEKNSETVNIMECFMSSSLFILFIIDLMSVILSILSIFGETFNMDIIVRPFHALKSNFILILAIDALVFKLRAGGGTGSSAGKQSSVDAYLQSKQNNTGIGYALGALNSHSFGHSNNESKINNIYNSNIYSTGAFKKDYQSSYDLYNKKNRGEPIASINTNINNDGINNNPLYGNSNGRKISLNDNKDSPLSGTTITDNISNYGKTEITINNQDSYSMKFKNNSQTDISPALSNKYSNNEIMSSFRSDGENNNKHSPTINNTALSKVSGISGIGNISIGLKYNNNRQKNISRSNSNSNSSSDSNNNNSMYNTYNSSNTTEGTKYSNNNNDRKGFNNSSSKSLLLKKKGSAQERLPTTHSGYMYTNGSSYKNPYLR